MQQVACKRRSSVGANLVIVCKFVMFKKFILSQLLKLFFCPRTVVKLR